MQRMHQPAMMTVRNDASCDYHERLLRDDYYVCNV